MNDPMGHLQGAASAQGADATREAAPGTDQQIKARSMRVNELKARVQGDAYVIDPHLVAEALLRRPNPRRVLVPDISRRGVHDRVGAAVPRRSQA
jgi:hypothetical protein